MSAVSSVTDVVCRLLRATCIGMPMAEAPDPVPTGSRAVSVIAGELSDRGRRRHIVRVGQPDDPGGGAAVEEELEDGAADVVREPGAVEEPAEVVLVVGEAEELDSGAGGAGVVVGCGVFSGWV